MGLLDHQKDKRDYLGGSIDQLHTTFISTLKSYYYKNVKLGGKRSLTSSQSCLLCIVCMHFGSLEVQMSEVSKIIKCRGFLALTIYTRLNLNNLM